MLINRSWLPMILRAPADDAGAAPVAPDAALAETPAADATPETVLFPNEAKPGDEAKEGAPDEGKKEGDEAKPDDKPAIDPDAVPDDGKYALTMPEGVSVDTELLDALGPEFKEMGLTNAQAQKLADKFAEVQGGRVAAHAGTPEGSWSAAAYQYYKENGSPDAWPDRAKADKEIGGAKWDATVSSAGRAVNQLGTPELKDYLNKSGGGNHPELIRFMSKVGAMISEDDPASGATAGSGKPAEAAHTLFPNDAPKG